MRWPHPDRGIISPDEFIPIAEDCGLIVPVTTIALEAAMRECRAWRDEGVSIRVRGQRLRALADRRAHHRRDPRAAARLAAPRLAAPAGADREHARRRSRRREQGAQPLREMGVSFALDDFGTGWSSLGQLNDLPFDELKIDRSFVLAMRPGSPEDAIVRSTIQLGRELGLRIVAEGVEDEATRARLADLGCDAAQGFLFAARPAGAIAPGADSRAAAPPGARSRASPPSSAFGASVRARRVGCRRWNRQAGRLRSVRAPRARTRRAAGPGADRQDQPVGRPAGASGRSSASRWPRRLRLPEARRGGAEVPASRRFPEDLGGAARRSGGRSRCWRSAGCSPRSRSATCRGRRGTSRPRASRRGGP